MVPVDPGGEMPVCITGMHRSGTSLVAHMLHACGVDLGPEGDMLKANEFNADGYWENRALVAMNDAVLDAVGGAWDLPPELFDGWEASAAVTPLQSLAQDIVRTLGLEEPWGWKDPRSSLTFPFWRRLYPSLRVVVCLRSPVEVAHSLERRGSMSHALGLSLWYAYNRNLVEGLSGNERVITHYDAYFSAPGAELRRILDRLGVSATDDALAKAAALAQPELRHHQVREQAAAEELPSDVLNLYIDMCADAGPNFGAVDLGVIASSAESSKPRPAVERDVLSRQELQARMEECRARARRLEEAQKEARARADRLQARADRLEQAQEKLRRDRDAWRRRAERFAQ